MGLYGLIFRGAPAIGALSAGAASAYFGLRPPILLGALLVLAAGLWTYRSREQISKALPSENLDAAASSDATPGKKQAEMCKATVTAELMPTSSLIAFVQSAAARYVLAISTSAASVRR